MAFDYKKEFKEYYLPPGRPMIVEIPKMNFIAVSGRGNPNEPDGEYGRVMNLLYGIAYTLKMSYKGGYKIGGFFEYVVPRWRAFGGRRGKRERTIQIKRPSGGFRQSAFRISCRRQISSGR